MSISDLIIGVIAPHQCIGRCGTEGSLLCANCAGKLQPRTPRCYRCGVFAADWRTCQTCRRHSKLTAVRITTAYEGLAKTLVWRLKFERAQAAALDIASVMQNLLNDLPEDIIITHVPTATSRIRRRGYDQAQLIARRLSRGSGHIYLPCLRRLGQVEQLGASARQRREQLAGAFDVIRPERFQGKTVVLVDDVLTTGATLEAAAAALRAAGAKRAEAIVFAQA